MGSVGDGAKVNGGVVVKNTDSYALLRDCNASTRLTAQHFLWKDLLGFLLHRDIPCSAPDLKVADVATGNGIWLHDFARDKPQTNEFHGFDISLDQANPKSWLGSNIQMHQWDIFEPPPSRFIGYFDVVHVRLLTVVIRGDDPRPVLENLTKLLKPGGYLQWDEVDSVGWHVKTTPGVTAKHLHQLHSQLTGTDTWKYYFQKTLAENGYQDDAQLYIYEYGLDSARFWNDSYVSAWKELATNKAYNPDDKSQQLPQSLLEQRGMEEVRKGASLMVPNLVWVAQKR